MLFKKERDELKRLRERTPLLADMAEQVLARLNDSFDIVDPDFMIVWANEGLVRQGQWAPGEITGRHCYEVFHKRESVCDSCPVAEVFATGRSSVQEQPFERPDGRRMWLQKHAWPILNEEDRIIYAVEYVRDITGQKRMEEELRAKTVHLEEANTSLRVLLRKWEENKRVLEGKALSGLKSMIMPYLESLKNSGLNAEQRTCLDLIESKIRDGAFSSFETLSGKFQNLTPTEIQVCDLIREGKSNKEIAHVLRLSEHTITFHRRNLRKKLGITSKKVNLRSYIQSLTEESACQPK
ncbi:MAG: LuxR C-terminal-related transcriptional regulator [Pseudomonadota bacterium]